MAKKKADDDGLTAAELKEVETFEANVAKDEAKAAAEPPMILSEPVSPAPSLKPEPLPDSTVVAAEIADLEAQIVTLQKKLHDLQKPVIEFPKMVKGRTFQDRAEQDAAGPEFAD